MIYMNELNSKQIIDIFDDRTTYFTDKLDGSYLRAGIDEDGRFYTTRQGNVRYYAIKDWPQLAWANSFRVAHGMLETTLEEIVRVKEEYLENTKYFYDGGNRRQYKSKNDFTGRSIYIDVEIINGIMPNTVLYDLINEREYGCAVSSDVSFFLTETHFFNASDYDDDFISDNDDEAIQTKIRQDSRLLETSIIDPILHIGVFCDQIITEDGKTLETKKQMFNGRLRTVPKKSISRMLNSSDLDITWIVKFNLTEASPFKLYLPSGGILQFDYVQLHELWDLKFVSCPSFISPETWRTHKSILISQLRAIKAQVQKKFQDKIYNHLKKRVCTISHDNDLCEGIVVVNATSGIKFKLIDPAFKRCNKLTHIVRYWLQDGRRPSKPCFLTRTAGWTDEAKLARLDVLLDRYMRKRADIFDFKFTDIGYRNPQLDQRTLVLFAEIRRDIQNGRYSVSRESTQDPA